MGRLFNVNEVFMDIDVDLLCLWLNYTACRTRNCDHYTNDLIFHTITITAQLLCCTTVHEVAN